MSKRWKLKTNSSNILLVLITLILIKAEWATGHDDTPPEVSESTENPPTEIYIGNDEIAQHYFRPSTHNNSLILDGVRQCLDSFQLLTCIKMLLLERINEVVKYMEKPDVIGKDLNLLHGLLVFKIKNETNGEGFGENGDHLNLDEEIAVKFQRIFRHRFLLINLLPKFKIEVEPKPESKDFICFSYKIQNGAVSDDDDWEENVIEGRKRKKGGGMGMMMLVPPMIMLGLMPFTLASLKAMVMNAVMINMMALNGAIFMTIRNLVFGPRRGDNVKYVNYGYSKDRQTQSKKPVLIIHSPAAFVKQPPVKSKHNQHHNHPQHHEGPHHLSSHSYHPHHQQHYDDSENYDYYVIQQDYSEHGSNYQHHNRRMSQWKGNPSNNFNKYNGENSQRKRMKPEMKTQINRNLNGSSHGFIYSNFGSKKPSGNYNYSRQIGQQPSLLF